MPTRDRKLMNKPVEKYQVKGGEGKAEEELHDSKGKAQRKIRDVRMSIKAHESKQGRKPSRTCTERKRKIWKLQRRKDKKMK